jgi:hypothetical protein
MGNHEYFSFPDISISDDIDNKRLVLSDGNIRWMHLQHEKSKLLKPLLIPDGNLDWLTSLPHIIEQDEFILVHAGLHPDHGIDTPREISTLIRLVDDRPWYESYKGTKPVIYGHWAAE